MSYNSSLVLLLAIALALLVTGFALFEKYKRALKLQAVVVTGYFFGVVGALLLVHAILYWPGAQQQIAAELAALAGSSLGWLIGMWLSPMGTSESTKFTKYWTAIGVGSGFTLKWAIDHVTQYRGWIADHAFISALFTVALVVTTAAVYNSRAYNNAVVIAPRQPMPSTVQIDGTAIKVTAGSTVALYAAVAGPNDPLAKWDIFPPSLGTVTQDGMFVAGDKPGSGRITAFNVEDPSLSCALPVEVTA